MRTQVLSVELNDDTWWELGADNEQFIRTALGDRLYQISQDLGIEFDLEFTNRDWNNQSQTITLWITAGGLTMTWFWLNYSPKELDN
jgi:hypothetical protein